MFTLLPFSLWHPIYDYKQGLYPRIEQSPTLDFPPLFPFVFPQDLSSLLRLWYHENLRIFSDRLINDEDRKWFADLLKEKMKANFEMSYDDVVPQDPIIYGDFMTQNIDVRPYIEIADHAKVE